MFTRFMELFDMAYITTKYLEMVPRSSLAMQAYQFLSPIWVFEITEVSEQAQIINQVYAARLCLQDIQIF